MLDKLRGMKDIFNTTKQEEDLLNISFGLFEIICSKIGIMNTPSGPNPSLSQTLHQLAKDLSNLLVSKINLSNPNEGELMKSMITIAMEVIFEPTWEKRFNVLKVHAKELVTKIPLLVTVMKVFDLLKQLRGIFAKTPSITFKTMGPENLNQVLKIIDVIQLIGKKLVIAANDFMRDLKDLKREKRGVMSVRYIFLFETNFF